MLDECKLIDMMVVQDGRGSLAICEGNLHVPFDMKRAYWMYGVAQGANRGEHAHKTLKQVLVAVSGTLDVELDDGISKQVYTLNSPAKGLFVKNMVWCTLQNFSAGASCLVLVSDYYDESEYIRRYDDFIRQVRAA